MIQLTKNTVQSRRPKSETSGRLITIQPTSQSQEAKGLLLHPLLPPKDLFTTKSPQHHHTTIPISLCSVSTGCQASCRNTVGKIGSNVNRSHSLASQQRTRTPTPQYLKANPATVRGDKGTREGKNEQRSTGKDARIVLFEGQNAGQKSGAHI